MRNPTLLLSLLLLSSFPRVLPAAQPIRVMLLDGESGGPYHAWRITTPVLKKELEETNLFQVEVTTAPASGQDFSQFHPRFQDFNVIVSNLDSPEWPDNLRADLEHFVTGGGGLVIVHAADNAFADWHAFNQMIGVGGWRKRNEAAGPMWFVDNGKLQSDSAPGNAGMHGARLPFAVTAVDGSHPILRGLPSVWMHAADELYAKLRGPGENMTVLASAYSDPGNHGTGRNEPILMVLHYGKGRIFHTVMGHDVSALSCVGFLTTFQRGTEWAATGKVTQKIPSSFPTANTVSYRSDLAAMDPDYRNGTAGFLKH